MQTAIIDSEEDRKRERREKKIERMKAKGTWKNNPDYKDTFIKTIYRGEDGEILPINDMIKEKFMKNKRKD